MKQGLTKAIVIAGWLIVWQGITALVANPVLLAGPLETARALFRLLPDAGFWQTVVFSLTRIWAGLFAGAALGILLAALAFALPFLHTVLSPLVSAMKTVPVACFAVMLLIWTGTANTAMIVTGLVVFPILFLNTYQGLQETDKELTEIADLFTMTRGDRIRHLYLPAVSPFIKSGMQLACGMSWKSGIAAEVIAQRTLTIGNSLYRARVLLETDTVFALTVTVVVLSFLTEKLVMLLLHRQVQ